MWPSCTTLPMTPTTCCTPADDRRPGRRPRRAAPRLHHVGARDGEHSDQQLRVSALSVHAEVSGSGARIPMQPQQRPFRGWFTASPPPGA